MGFFSSLFSSDLYNEEQLNFICESMSERIVSQSIASAHALNYLAQYCGKENEGSSSYVGVINSIYRNLGNIEWYSNHYAYKAPPAEEVDYFSYSPFSINVTKFMYYYITRLPIILNGTTRSQKHFSEKEKDIISKACLSAVFQSKYHFSPYISEDTPAISITRDFRKARQLSSEKDKLEFINNYQSFLRQPVDKQEVLDSILALSRNQLFMFTKILDENFIVFYKGLQNYLADYCMIHIMMKLK